VQTVTEQDVSRAAIGGRETVGRSGPEGSKGRMDQVITAVVDGVIVPVTGVIPVLLTSGILFLVFAALWLAFGAGLVLNQGGLDNAWEWIRGLPLILQGVAWLLFLPVVGALWAWETSWPLVLRLVIVAGLCGWSLMIFLPRSAQA
jgi:hypothetical protein